jgi:glycosyltransferase involved in cell wall biosynthesis
MKVIVNALGYSGQGDGAGGAGVFLQYLVSQLPEQCDVDVLVRPQSKAFQGRAQRARLIELPYLTGETLGHLRAGPTVVLDPYGGLPCGPFPDDIGLCVIVHDLMHLERPHFFTATERRDRSIGFSHGLQRADGIITFSADQARAIRHYFPGTDPVVIPHLPYITLANGAVPHDEAKLPPELRRFVLFPGVKWPHKNHKAVIEAFDAYIRWSGSDLRLVMCGGACAENRFSFLPSADSLSDHVMDMGLVPEDMLRALFSRAEAVIFPTEYEGFGIPVLEAAYQGKMVVASALAVFDEILGPTTYRRITDSQCHLRWLEAFADLEGSARADYEARSQAAKRHVDIGGFTNRFLDVLKGAAERYSHPDLYVLRKFSTGDRLTTSLLAKLNFADLYGSAVLENGTRHPALGLKPGAASSSVYRSTGMSADRKQCLRAEFTVSPEQAEDTGELQFSAWVRLHGEPALDALNWSVNDRGIINLLPMLSDGDWHLVRAPVPNAGYIDFRGLRGGASEVVGFDLEVHDPSILRIVDFPPPDAEPRLDGLTVFVAALSDTGVALDQILGSIGAMNEALPLAEASLRWVVVTDVGGLGNEVNSAVLPANLRIHLVAQGVTSRAGATGFVSPYQPISKLLLIEASDLAACLEKDNLDVLAAALRPSVVNGRALVLERGKAGFWSDDERGIILDVANRLGQPIPVLDPGVIHAAANRKEPRKRPRFAVIETDLTTAISHHSSVSGLFLDGAKELGFEPVLGLHRTASSDPTAGGTEVWSGFSEQVYDVGSADKFAEEMASFVAAVGLGPSDIVFMHSLSPQIVLGAARFIAANPATAPTFVMRFFSTAEAMTGHGLSYVKILRSIENMRVVRQKMHFFCESKNLVEYYRTRIGCLYPILFNPVHPSAAVVRDSTWCDPNLGGGHTPILAYFGEAREEKGFEHIPAIVGKLIEAESMSAFQFLIQTGSNKNNDTAKIAYARSAIIALKAKYPTRIRLFESVDTPEQFYFLMKHARGVIAPYSTTSYAIRGSGVTLEALQMGLDVFTWEDNDLYATFSETGRTFGVRDGASFADVIIDRYSAPSTVEPKPLPSLMNLSPSAVVERVLSLCGQDAALGDGEAREVVLWTGNDTMGEGCSAVYASQKLAMRALGKDCLELFVPWPDPNWAGVDSGAYDAKLYGFDSQYESTGLGWVAKPTYTPELYATLEEIARNGPTYRGLRTLNENFTIPPLLKQAIAKNDVSRFLLNYSHLYPVIESVAPLSQIICETHDIIAYQHAVRRGTPVSLVEKIDEFRDLSAFPQIIAISADEQREMAGACPNSAVHWRLPPFRPEPAPLSVVMPPYARQVEQLRLLGGIPDAVVAPSAAMMRAYYMRPDLQSTFRLDTREGRTAFFCWWFFFGQHEMAEGFGLTRRQFQWVAAGDVKEPSVERKGSGRAAGKKPVPLSGAYMLILAAREDLRRVFVNEAGNINLRGLEDWAAGNAEREFGLGKLIKRGTELFAATPTRPVLEVNRVLSAVVDANPLVGENNQRHLTSLLDRIDDVDMIDMVIVGSNHPSNVVSFNWFLEEVFLKYLAPKEHNLFIVGTVCDELKQLTHRNIFALGRCARLGPLLEASTACPIPVIAGSGSPIKTIPAMALNGAVTMTEHVARAFRLADYGIPAFLEADEFADDLLGLLTDPALRQERQTQCARYVKDHLDFSSYVRFWGGLLGGASASRSEPTPASPSRSSAGVLADVAS